MTFKNFWFLTMIHILKMRHSSPCKERFFLARKGILVKEDKWRRERKKIETKKRKHFHRRKRRARKRCNSNLVGHQRNNQNRKKCGVSLYRNLCQFFWSLPLFQPFWSKKYRGFMFCKKEYDVYYTFKTYFIHFKRPWALQQLL